MSILVEREELVERVRKAAEVLKWHFGARRVILFGSFADGKRFRPDSDIDLAAEGVEPSDHWDAWWLCEEIVEDWPVDLVPIERAEESVLRAIEQGGIEL